MEASNLTLTGSTQYDDLNGSNPSFGIIFDGLTVYPSPYIVLTEKQYTKHYYVGTDKIATMIGDGGLLLEANHLSNEQRGQIKDGFCKTVEPTAFQYEKTMNMDIQGMSQSKIEYECGYIDRVDLSINSFTPMLEQMMHIWQNSNECKNEIYYTHGDHLGSANWITDADGKPVQYIHYAPYGEQIANKTPYGYDERFKFTGKERDWETGYDYFGARFYWSADGIFTTVDPLADKYPGNTPYLYCGGNPIMLVDPDGRDVKKFLRGLQRNITANMSLSIGLQLGLKFNLAKKLDVEAEMNFGSYQIDNEHDIANPAWKVGAGLMVENFGLKVTETVSDRENKTATKEQNIQIGAGIANIDITTTTNYNETKRGGYEHYVQVGKENTEVTMEQTLISENLEIDAGVSALIGLEISINVNVIQMINDLLD